MNFKYNWGNSQLGVTYNINYRNYNKRILDEDISYAVEGTIYQKQKNGKKSPYAYEQQMAEISFNKLQIGQLHLQHQTLIQFPESQTLFRSGYYIYRQ